jgi:NAD(P)-dependent dehydrogenase (short-subunit alcohol dehydrogenase family)
MGDKLVDAIKRKEQKVHILVNNSGAVFIAHYDKFVTWRLLLLVCSANRGIRFPEKEGWDDILALNIKSIFYCKFPCSISIASDVTYECFSDTGVFITTYLAVTVLSSE